MISAVTCNNSTDLSNTFIQAIELCWPVFIRCVGMMCGTKHVKV
jgi:hypothetical protein